MAGGHGPLVLKSADPNRARDAASRTQGWNAGGHGQFCLVLAVVGPVGLHRDSACDTAAKARKTA
jgi:hypothetical protein